MIGTMMTVPTSSRDWDSGDGGSLPIVDLKWNQPGPHADPQPDGVHNASPLVREPKAQTSASENRS
jgi:hypothetical protein